MLLILLACADPPAQTEACRDYVACLAARDAVLNITTDAARFEAGGDCWGGLEEGALLCDRACAAGLEWLRGAEPGLPGECR